MTRTLTTAELFRYHLTGQLPDDCVENLPVEELQSSDPSAGKGSDKLKVTKEDS